jgi:hypothetical protein
VAAPLATRRDRWMKYELDSRHGTSTCLLAVPPAVKVSNSG